MDRPPNNRDKYKSSDGFEPHNWHSIRKRSDLGMDQYTFDQRKLSFQRNARLIDNQLNK